MLLPLPDSSQAYCDVSALEAGLIHLRDDRFITDAPKDHVTLAPSLSFVLQHSKNNQKFLFDLGIRRDWDAYPPDVINTIKTIYPVQVPQNVVESLSKGGLTPSDITTVCLSHCHWDHVGDTSPFTQSVFVVGGAAKSLFIPGYPADPGSPYASNLLPVGRTRFLELASDWKPLGPFPRTLDFYGDGSLYIVEALGHLPGHINVLARTSPDGGWIYLAGDSAHHWNLITGESDIAVGPHPHHVCAHVDKELAAQHIARIQELNKMYRVRVLLAHDAPWYNANKGGAQFFPGKIKSL